MDSMCRTCTRALGAESSICYHILDTGNLYDILINCSIPMDCSSNYPPWICQTCYAKVLEFTEFQSMCQRSLDKFNLMLRELETKTGFGSGVTVDGNITQTTNTEVTNALSTTEYRQSDSIEKDAKEDQQKGEHITIRHRHSCENVEAPALRCNICSKTYRNQHLLDAHRRKHKCVLTYACEHNDCSRSFNCYNSYQEHLKTHSDSRDLYECDVNQCAKVYKSKSALNVHKRMYHMCGPPLKTHMCEICGKVFKSSSLLNEHSFTHVDKSQLPHSCDETGCRKRFSTKEKLKIHKKRHAGIKNFICSHCGVRKTTRNELKIHINYHTLERTWACRFCEKVCHSAGNLKVHVRTIHERVKDFACRYCERTFAKPDTKKYHEMIHTGEKPHACDECGRRFLQPAALRTHRKIHLKENSECITEKT